MDNNENPLMAISKENTRLCEENKKLSNQLAIAIEGLNALISSGVMSDITQKTLQAIKDCDEDLPQE